MEIYVLNPVSSVWINSGTGIAHNPSPCEQVTSPTEVSSSRKKASVNTNPNKK